MKFTLELGNEDVKKAIRDYVEQRLSDIPNAELADDPVKIEFTNTKQAIAKVNINIAEE